MTFIYRSNVGRQKKAVHIIAAVGSICVISSLVLTVFTSPVIGIPWLLISLIILYFSRVTNKKISSDNYISIDENQIATMVGGEHRVMKIFDITSIYLDEEEGAITIALTNAEKVSYSTFHIFPSIEAAKEFEKKAMAQVKDRHLKKNFRTGM